MSVLRRLSALPLAVLLVVGAALVPPAAAPVTPFLAAFDAPVARAAGGLTVTTTAAYVVVPAEAVVRVTVDVTLRNVQPTVVSGGVVTRYYFDGVNLAIQPEAVRFRATQGGTSLHVQVAPKRGYTIASVLLRRSLYFQQSTTLRLTYELPAGTPRSASDIRVSRAFATFPAWAFGDTGSVRIEVPRPYAVEVSGDEMAQAITGGATILTASTSDPPAWYASINARNDDALTRDALDVRGGEQIVVRGWPEDAAWRREVGNVLTRGVPDLVQRIGLPWPVDGALAVTEIHTPLLEGYAGFYDTATDEITVGEDLDDQTIVHEVSHAWFNGGLFTERWISEGLADEYAARVLGALGQVVPGPGDVRPTSRYAFALNDWPPPAAIRDDTSSGREHFGYDAAWTVIRQVVASAGEDGMRAVFKAAADGTIAYVGAGAPERSALPGDWRRFLDLAEELGGATGVADLLATWALPAGSGAGLRARATARAAYHALLAESDGWAAPYAVRSPMDRWAYADAEAAIGEAARILERRDATATLARAQGLAPSGALRAVYEGAPDAAALATAATLAAEGQSSLEAIAAAVGAAVAPRDWVVSLGLEGTDPDGDLAAARVAWTAGDLATAAQRATLASSTLAGAPEAGRLRATVIGIGGALLLLLVLALLLALRRRRRLRRRAALAALAVRPAGPLDEPPEASDGYATLPPSAAAGAEPAPPSNEPKGTEPS